MANSRRLVVQIVGDSSSFERSLGRSSAATTRFGRDVQQVGAATTKLDKLSALKGFGAGLIASEAIRGMRDFVDVASNLNEQTAKTQVVFGGAAAGIERWARSTATGIGLARDQALEAVATLGNMARSMGVGEQEAADLSRSLVDLAGDLASFNNASPEDALLALRSAIVGEYEPLRRFGSALSEARVQQQAMAESGKRSTRELTNQEKIIARYHLILKDTALAQGDFARTADGLANKQRALASQTRDLEGRIGAGIVPVMTDLVTVLNEGANAADAFAEALNKIGGGGGGAGGRGGIFNTGVSGSDLVFLPAVAIAADLIRLLKEPSEGEGTSAAARAFAEKVPTGADVFKKLATAPPPQSVFDTARAPLVNIPVGFQNAILKAQNEDDRSGLAKALINTRRFEEQQLQRATDAGDTKAINQIRSNIEGLQSQIVGVYSQIAADTAKAKDKVASAAERAKDNAQKASDAAATAYRDRLANTHTLIEIAKIEAEGTKGNADNLSAQRRLIAFLRKASQAPKLSGTEQLGYAEQLARAMLELQNTVSDSLKTQAEKLRKRASDFKTDVLAALDREQESADTSRQLRDAKDQLRDARVAGGKIGLRDALEGVADARRARARFLAAGSTFSPGAGGVNVNGAITVNVNGAKSPKAVADEIIGILQRRGRQGASQFSGRNPGGHILP